jgi:hypothetical protein
MKIIKIVLLALTLAVLVCAAVPAFAQRANSNQLAEALRAGGSVLLVRHRANFSNQVAARSNGQRQN